MTPFNCNYLLEAPPTHALGAGFSPQQAPGEEGPFLDSCPWGPPPHAAPVPGEQPAQPRRSPVLLKASAPGCFLGLPLLSSSHVPGVFRV